MFEEFIYHLLIKYGYIGIFALMILQTIFVIIPSEAVITLSGALGLNQKNVIIVTSLGLIIGSIIAFFISRYFGRRFVKRLIGEEFVSEVDDWIERNGTKAILIARLVPLIPFDLISYVAGLTRIDFKKYLFATIAGMIPRIIFLVFVGDTAKRILSIIGMGVDFILLFGIIGIILIIFLERRGYLRGVKSFVLRGIIKRNKFYRKKR
ncbi:MAG: TVP38/TMEM64 family protein [Candidatus Aenigmatarchaeota archaeon]